MKLILRPPEDEPKQALFLAEFCECVAVMIEQPIAFLLEEAGPTILLRNRARMVIWGLRALVRHLEEQQIRQLLDVITVAHPVVAEDVAVVPEFLNNLI
ncbi:MAG: hypothetical protein QM771_17155 [Nitrospira sp.]